MTLKELIKKKGYTQEEFAKSLNIKQSCVSAWVTGRTKPTTARLSKVAKALGISVNKLIEVLNNDISA